MTRFLVILFLLCGLGTRVRAQDSTAVGSKPDTTSSTTTSADLLADLTDSSASAQPLLPHKMLFTQRVFWGPKGLLRLTDIAPPLTPAGRAKELKIRRTTLVAHQVMGFVTLAGFVAQGFLGAKLYNAKGEDYTRLHSAHEATATAINISYATTALLSLTAPPKLLDERRGLSGIKLHKYLAVVHLAGMVATNILAHMIDTHPDLKPYHRAAAYTTFAAFATSIIAIKF